MFSCYAKKKHKLLTRRFTVSEPLNNSVKHALCQTMCVQDGNQKTNMLHSQQMCLPSGCSCRQNLRLRWEQLLGACAAVSLLQAYEVHTKDKGHVFQRGATDTCSAVIYTHFHSKTFHRLKRSTSNSETE